MMNTTVCLQFECHLTNKTQIVNAGERNSQIIGKSSTAVAAATKTKHARDITLITASGRFHDSCITLYDFHRAIDETEPRISPDFYLSPKVLKKIMALSLIYTARLLVFTAFYGPIISFLENYGLLRPFMAAWELCIKSRKLMIFALPKVVSLFYSAQNPQCI